MIIDTELISDLTFTLLPTESKLIKINGVTSTCAISTECNSGAYVVKSTLDSDEFVKVSLESDITWEFIKLSSVTYEELTVDIPSLVFTAPNLLYIKNTSTGTETLKVSLRGNR